MSTYSIGEMAQKLGKSVKTLMNWDKSGALKAYRTPTNRRFYTHEQYLEAAGKMNYKKGSNSDLDAVLGKTVLITGGTGTLGHALVKRIADYTKKVVVYSRCELKQANMREEFKDKENLRFLVGDIRDKERLMIALKDVDICIHAACMKRVDTCSYNPFEAVKSNVIGSMNVLEACMANKVAKTLMVSSDKATASATLYGGTKFIAEQMFINGNNYSTRDCIFMASRYGNVFASNGSVRHIFEKQFKDTGKIKVTHEEMTRFFMSIGDAVDLNLFALNNSIGGEIFIPKLKSTKMIEFAKAFFPDAEIEIVGVRGHEKIHEELISETEMRYVVDCGKYYKVVPPGAADGTVGWDAEYPQEPREKPFKYSSDAVKQFTHEELKAFEK